MSEPYVECPYKVLGIDHHTFEKEIVHAAHQKLIQEVLDSGITGPTTAVKIDKLSRAKDMALATFGGTEEEEEERYNKQESQISLTDLLYEYDKEPPALLDSAEGRRARLHDNLYAFFTAEQNRLWKNNLEPLTFSGSDNNNPDAKEFRQHIERMNDMAARMYAKLFAEESMMKIGDLLEYRTDDVVWHTSDQELRMKWKYKECEWHSDNAASREEVAQAECNEELDRTLRKLRN